MPLDENSTYYDVLDLKVDASPQEVREAYLRTKATYNRDSVALYSLISQEEREEMLQRIEEAYQVLSSAEKRKEYDFRFGMLDDESNTPLPARPPSRKIISIDRVPPMETEAMGEELLVAPATDFSEGERRRIPDEAEESGAPEAHSYKDPMAREPIDPDSVQRAVPPPMQAAPAAAAREAARNENMRRERVIIEEIALETEFRGAFLKKVRETRRISVEEMSSITKINKSYLLALEEENFQKLPATVFVRGFVNQLAKTLRLPADKVVSAYMGRYAHARPEKAR